MGDLNHSLLLRQLKRVFGAAPIPPELIPLLDAVNEAYREFDADRALLERSLDLSSQELMQANADMSALFRAFPDQFYRLDTRGVVLDHRGGSAAGEGAERVIGRAFHELLPEASVPEYEMTRARVRLQRRTASFEYTRGEAGAETAFEARVVPLLEDQAVVIVRAITERRRAEASATALARVSGEIAATLDLDRAMQLVVDSLHGLFRVRRAVLWRLDPVSGALVCRAAAGRDDGMAWVGSTLAPGEGVAGLAVAQARIVWSANLTADTGLALPAWAKANAYQEGYRSVLGVPLISRDTVIGALVVGDEAGRFYTEEEKRLLLGFANQAAIAVENARLFEDSERRRRAAEAVASVGRLVSESLEPADVGQRIVHALTEMFRAQMSVLYLVERASDDLVLFAGWGPHVDWNQRLRRGNALVGRAIAEGRPLASNDVLAVPLVAHDRILGALAVGDRGGRIFAREDLELVQGFADQAALALANAELYGETRARLGQMRRLAELSQLITSSLDQHRVLDFVTEAALDLLHGDLARLWLVEGTDGRLRLAASRARGELPAEGGVDELPPGVGLAGWVVTERRSRSATDLLSDPQVFQKDWFAKAGIVSQLVVPLVAGDAAMGALVVSTRTRRAFDREEVELMEIFAAKAAIALSNARLYREAREAYEQLARAQDLLTQAQKMDAVGRLAGGVAHDFNNLLTVIIGRLDALLEELPADDGHRSDLELIQGAAERASALTRQLLAFGRRQALAPTVVDLNAIVRDVALLLRRLIGEDIELVTTLAPGALHVRADRSQLEQVIVNLAANARDAMPEGGRLTIRTEQVDVADAPPAGVDTAAGTYVLLAVSDSGHGMDPDTRRRVFDPFFTTKEIGRGTGLGLATVYGIVKQHDGHIAVDSSPGAGAVFRIYLPRADADVTAPAPSAAPRLMGSETILLVEDEDGVRSLARQALETAGYRVIEASLPSEALRIAAEWPQPIHLLVTDVVMPQMNGREVADAVRRARPAVRTLFISGYTADATALSTDLDGPGRAFLAKPFTGRTLAQKVREILDRG